MEEKCQALGIGDLLITRLLFDTYNIDDKININLNIINDYRDGSESYIIFIKYILNKLFPDKYNIIDKDVIKIHYYFNYYDFNPKYNNLIKYFDTSFDTKNELYKNEYLVFHTKLRIDNFSFHEDFISTITNYFSNYKTNHKIVILGERKMSQNLETRRHNIQCVYDQIIKLKDNNEVIDMTTEELYNTPNIDIFERDIKVIANAKKVFGFGWGGNFAMTWAVNNNFSFYINNLQHPIISFFQSINKKSLVREISDFFDNINEFKN